MLLLYKAVKSCYINMSKMFKTILSLGIGIFLLQLTVCTLLNIYFIYSGYSSIETKNLANILFSSAFQQIALCSIVCIFGDYILSGKTGE